MTIRVRWALGVCLALAMLGLVWSFLGNPLVFDDMYFFLPGAPERFFADGARFYPRWWVYETLAVTFVLLGDNVFWLRLGNIFLHLGVVFALYFFIRRLLLDVCGGDRHPSRIEWAAWGATALFAVHPLALFTQGYLIQRTILCATLFSLLCLLAFWRGLKGDRYALWGSCVFYVIAIYAKEHVIALPAACLALWFLYTRSGFALKLSRIEIMTVIAVQLCIALVVVLQLRGIIGSPYEMMLSEVLLDEETAPVEYLYGLSLLNQAGLFFKYIGLWLLPNPGWLSIDMREAFPLGFDSAMLWVGGGAFVLYVLACANLLLRGGLLGLIGFCLLLPSILFITELSTVRLQEPFVLYRSYLWMPSLFILIAILLTRISVGLVSVLLFAFGILWVGLSLGRLQVLSHPYLVWSEAAENLERKQDLTGVYGGYRIYYNLGNASYNVGMLDKALEAYDMVIKIKPSFVAVHQQRGVVFMDMQKPEQAIESFQRAIELDSGNVKGYLGLSKVYLARGDVESSVRVLSSACNLGLKLACSEQGAP